MSIVSIAVAILGLVFSLFTYFYCVNHERKQATIDAYSKLQSEALDQINQYTSKQVSQIAEHPHSPEYKALAVLLARCEHFAVGVKEKIYDEHILTKLAGRYFVSLYEKLEPMVLKKRSLGHRELYYAEFEELAHRVNKQLMQPKEK